MWRQHYDIHTDRHTYIYIQTYIHTDRQTEPNYYIDSPVHLTILYRYTGWVICRCTLCCVSKNRNKGLILCTTKCYSCQVAYRSELSQTARISLLVYERNSCRASSFQCIYPCFNKSFINGWVLSETQNGMFTKNAATVLAQFRLNSVWLSKWHTAKHEKENVRLFRKCEKSLKVSESDEMWHDC